MYTLNMSIKMELEQKVMEKRQINSKTALFVLTLFTNCDRKCASGDADAVINGNWFHM